jgi:uncharacterized protein
MADLQHRLIVKCPHCSQPVVWTTENPFRPFCCERCKLIDLGEWAMEEKSIPGEPVHDENGNHEEDYNQ